MDELRFTLLADGPSDVALVPILSWLLAQHLPGRALQVQFADLGRLRIRPDSQVDRIHYALELYPCDVLFVHRDAEGQPPDWRRDQIQAAIRAAELRTPYVCVVPIRMTEAWLLFDQAAIRRAAGNPYGRSELALPALREVESLPDPKDVLRSALLKASELKGRRLKDFRTSPRRVAELIRDFSPLRELSAFCQLEDDLASILLAFTAS
jgi:hypothetical protein